ncbi:MAG: tRNA adenosine(34) deaminase TadA [Desulfobacterales bacterium]|nr:tRNA adenosine(34) deaminase TadA [Desulfobacterales bacterium]
MSHEAYMQQAIAEARKAFEEDEVPVGAILIDADGGIVAAAHNQVIRLCDISAHAEVLALRKAGQAVKNYRLPHTSLYVTIEPCVMCMGALVHARVQRIVYGASDPKWGAAGSLYRIGEDNRMNHQPEIIAGVCEETCKQLMLDFFRVRRNMPSSPGVPDEF